MTTDQDEVWQAAGLRLRAIRISAGLSQEELAMDADWDQSTLSKVERSGPHLVSFGKLKTLVDALGYTIEVMIRSTTGEPGEAAWHSPGAINLRAIAKSAASGGNVVDVTFRARN